LLLLSKFSQIVCTQGALVMTPHVTAR